MMPDGGARRRVPPIYPLLLAPAPAISIAAANAGQFEIRDLLTIVAAIELCTLAALVISWSTVLLVVGPGRRARALRHASLAVGVLVAWCFYFEPVREALEHLSWRLSRPPVVATVAAITTVGLLWLVARRPSIVDRLTTPITAFGAIVVAMSGIRILTGGASAPAAVARSQLVAALAQPIRTRAEVAARHNTPRRSVYLIVSDEHANAAVLSRYLSFDNSRFEDSLRALGFVVPADMRSNYNETILSLPSLLNFAHIVQLQRDLGPGETAVTVPKYLVEHNRTERFLRAQGYRFVFIPSAWFPLTRHNHDATETIHVGAEVGPAAAMRRTELRTAVVQSTPIGLLAPAPTGDWRRLGRTMDAIARIAADTTPSFVFAHVMRPHPPYGLDAACNPLPHQIGTPGSVGTSAERAPYLGQLECVDRQILALATTLLRTSRTPPVIIIVGDHGTRFSDPYFFEHPQRVSADFIRERFGAFGAFYAPAGGDTLFKDRATLVNVMRNVLAYYFGADLPREPDTQYVSGDHPYEFFPVDSATGQVAAGSSPGRRPAAVARVTDGTPSAPQPF